jgi:Integrase core domain
MSPWHEAADHILICEGRFRGEADKQGRVASTAWVEDVESPGGISPPGAPWINVTSHPTVEWIAQQITEAFPWSEAPRYLIRDQDGIYGAAGVRRLRAMGIRDKPIAPGSPWQNAFAERLIGSIRRECVDHMVVFGEAHLRRVLNSYARYYNESRIHRALSKDAPFPRAIERLGVITSRPVLGGLHHQYCRI